MVSEGHIELVAPIIAASARSGTLLVARAERPLTEIERRTVERSALMASLVMLRRNALADAEERVRGEVATELLEGAVSRAGGLRRAVARGYPVDGPWSLLTLPCSLEDRPRLLARLRVRADWLVASSPLGVTVLAPMRAGLDPGESDAMATARGVQSAAGASAPLIVASSQASLEAAAVAAPEIWQVAQLADGLGIGRGVIDAAMLAPYALVFDGDGARLAAFVGSMLAPLHEWDRAHGATLLDTLTTLFDERWSLTSAARVLHVHLNTVKQRVQRLRLLFGEDLDRPEARFRLELAVRIERARRAAAP